MLARKRRFILLLLPLLLQSFPAQAMNMPSYDRTSLVYMSTDIVVADIASDEKHQLIATVTETLYGTIKPGEKLDTLTEFLTYFRPMQDGMRVVLFLDRRPHIYDFIYSHLAKSPFAVLPSGVYLVDPYGHVHTYYQSQNPGPYVASGYRYFMKKKEPTEEEDLRLPTIEDMKSRIAESAKLVEPIRQLLAKAATREDVPELLHLVDRTSSNGEDCQLRLAKAIGDRAMAQLRSFGDPALLLKANAVGGSAGSYDRALEFTAPADNKPDQSIAPARGSYLLRVMSDPKADVYLRVAAVQMLAKISSYSHPYSGYPVVLPLDGPPVAAAAVEIQAEAKSLLADENQDEHLRALSVQFLSMKETKNVEQAEKVYVSTRSNAVRYAIEEAFLQESDDLFASLKAPGGADASIVEVAPLCACDRSPTRGVLFSEKQQMGKGGNADAFRMVLKDIWTGRRFYVEEPEVNRGWRSLNASGALIGLGPLTNVPAGDYVLLNEMSRDGKPLGDGYGVRLRVSDSPEGKQIVAFK